MKAAVISLGSVSSQWTAEAMKKYFDEVDMLHIKAMDVKLGADAGVYHNATPMKNYDCVLVKGSFRYANLLRAISTLLKGKCYIPIVPHAFTSVHNKLLTHLELQRHNIPMPRTYILPSTKEAKIFLETSSYPIVMKFPEGTQGKGVMLAESQASASAMLDALGALRQPFIIQEYIESGDVDIRAFVVGDKIAASMMRVAKKGEIRGNIHAGGTGKMYELDRQERKVALEASRVLGAGICGIDMLHGPKGPLVIEANISPGLQGITAVTGVDVADKIARFLFDEAKKFSQVQNKSEAEKILSEKLVDANDKELITNLTFKGDRIVLPGVVTKATGFKEDADYSIKTEKGKLVIEEFKVKRG